VRARNGDRTSIGDRARAAGGVLDAIGRTPLVRLERLVPGNGSEVFAKLEMTNPGGSIKDRIARRMVLDAEADGRLRPGATIVEPTSGNTGIGLAMVAAARGYDLVIVMPESVGEERELALRLYGAELALTPAAEGMAGAVDEARRIAAESGGWMPDQFSNPSNPAAHYEGTAGEILDQLKDGVDCFVCGVGTGGTLTGVGRRLREHRSNLRIVAVEPAASPVLSGGRPGTHGIQGIGAGFVPEVLDTTLIDEVTTVTDEQALEMARLLARREGIFAGISAGAAVFASLRKAEAAPGARVLTILPDSGSRYLSVFENVDATWRPPRRRDARPGTDGVRRA